MQQLSSMYSELWIYEVGEKCKAGGSWLLQHVSFIVSQNRAYLKDDSNKQFTPQTSAGSLQYGFQ